MKNHDLKQVGAAFQIPGDFVRAERYGSGHINDTYAAVYSQGGAPVRYIHQRINHDIFKDVAALMANVEAVTAFAHGKLADAGVTDRSRRALTLVPSREGTSYTQDEQGQFWRTYIFIEGATTYDLIESPAQAYEAAKAFGAFQRLLMDYPGPRLAETIPFFHHTRHRFDTVQEAIREDVCNRAATVAPEIAFAEAREGWVDRLLNLAAAGKLPERITHNDTKLNNVLIDDLSGEGVCVIDLDTVMPGLVLYDFGDMVRTATRPCAEDERDLSRVQADMQMFAALARGYLASANAFLTPGERQHLVFSAKLITYEIGLRFLADYLQGDIYFRTHRPGHNLDRCRVQFAMVESLETHEEAMQGLVDSQS